MTVPFRLALLLLVGCTPADQEVATQMDQHGGYLRTEGAVTEALNKPAGPDYAAAIGIIERSGRAELQRDYDIGNLMLASCRDQAAFCTGSATATAGLAKLRRVATTPGEDAEVAAGDLALWYGRGAGSALAPDPPRAECWTGVRDGKAKASTCTTR